MLIGQAQANGSYRGRSCVELLSQDHVIQSLTMESSDFGNLGWGKFLFAYGATLISGLRKAGKQAREKTGFALLGVLNSLKGPGYLFFRLLGSRFSSVGLCYFGNHFSRHLPSCKFFSEIFNCIATLLHSGFLSSAVFEIALHRMMTPHKARPGCFGDIKFGMKGVQVILFALQQRINLASFEDAKLKGVFSIQIPCSLKVDTGMFAISNHGKMVDLTFGEAASGTDVPFSVGFAENFVDPANAFLGWVCARITHALAVPFSLRAVGCFRTVNGNLISSPIIPNFNVRNLRRNWLPAAENEGDGPSSGRSLQGTL